MAKIILVTGGCRSGKSAYAQQLAERLSSSRLYVATCPVTDNEMRARVKAHQHLRDEQGGWETIEEQLDLAGVVQRSGHEVLLVECLTLWVNNLMYAAELAARASATSQPPSPPAPLPSCRERHAGEGSRAILTESEIVAYCGRVINAAKARSGTVIFVTNEVGMGIVPENAAARRFRDLAGRTNRLIAASADAVTMVVCGIPWHLKGNPT